MTTAVAVERGLSLKKVRHTSATVYARDFLSLPAGSTVSVRVRSYDTTLPEAPDFIHRSTHAYVERDGDRPPSTLTRTFQTRKGQHIPETVTVAFVPKGKARRHIEAHNRWYKHHHQ